MKKRIYKIGDIIDYIGSPMKITQIINDGYYLVHKHGWRAFIGTHNIYKYKKIMREKVHNHPHTNIFKQ